MWFFYKISGSSCFSLSKLSRQASSLDELKSKYKVLKRFGFKNSIYDGSILKKEIPSLFGNELFWQV